MPANVVKTPADEKKWEKAKEYAKKSRDPSDKQYWGLVMTIYKNMKESKEVRSFKKEIYENRMSIAKKQFFKIYEAVNIKAAAITKLVYLLRDAIKNDDRSGEEKAAMLIQKEMMIQGKNIQAAFAKDYMSFIKAKEKELSDTFGFEVRLIMDGKPYLQPTGSNKSRFAVRSNFSLYFIVEPPVVK